MKEREFQANVLQVARYTGWMAYHTHDSRRSNPGFPDLVLVKPPRVLFVELKSRTGRVSDSQKEWLAALSECSDVSTHLWWPDDWAEISKVLGEGRIK